ncbi:PAS domain S-box protein [Anopheles sinensis]|uniref:PAS domain S-box protein n=1 Tax=Anopheles sinensis TaxID=74873 RepID=A0A084W7Y2_ANOSI|nr:PAS domain S-box protein [Anopheles sinensis]
MFLHQAAESGSREFAYIFAAGYEYRDRCEQDGGWTWVGWPGSTRAGACYFCASKQPKWSGKSRKRAAAVYLYARGTFFLGRNLPENARNDSTPSVPGPIAMQHGGVSLWHNPGESRGNEFGEDDDRSISLHPCSVHLPFECDRQRCCSTLVSDFVGFGRVCMCVAESSH